MLKGLEIKNPTDREVEKGCTKQHCDHAKFFPGYDSDSDVFQDDFKFTSESSEDSSETEEEEIEIPEESKISRTLGDNTTRTVVILVLSLLIMQSVCSVDTYVDAVHVHQQGLYQLVRLYDKGPDYWDSYKKAREFYIDQTSKRSEGKFPIVYFNSPDPSGDDYQTTLSVQEWAPFRKSLRAPEQKQVSLESKNGLKF